MKSLSEISAALRKKADMKNSFGYVGERDELRAFADVIDRRSAQSSAERTITERVLEEPK